MGRSRSLVRIAGSALFALPLSLLLFSIGPLAGETVPPGALSVPHLPATSEFASSESLGAEAGASDPAQGKKQDKVHEAPSLQSALLWLWNLADSQGPGKEGQDNDLGKAAVFSIALLAAFLTAVEVWQIPPPPRRRARPAGEGESETSGIDGSTLTEAASPLSTTPPTYGAATLLFQSNFARTVLSGLAGMALVSTFDGFWKNGQNSFEEEPLYLVLFVLLFLLFLTLSALIRAFTEAVRSRVSLVRRSVPGALPLRRFWDWLLSLRVPALVFFDTGFNVIQGKNQLQTAAFEQDIVELHRSIVLAVCKIRQRLDEAFLEALRGKGGSGWDGEGRSNASVRVSISLMASDERSVFYVAREVGSLAKAFGPDSLAWLALYSGVPLWYERHWDPATTLLIDNTTGTYEGLPKQRLLLENYLEKRNQSDYGAFVVLPLPWGHRGEAEGYRKVGIHVSFRHEKDMNHLWPRLKKEPKTKAAEEEGGPPDLLGQDDHPHPSNPKLAATLQISATVLSELFRHFNELVFEEQIRPALRPE